MTSTMKRLRRKKPSEHIFDAFNILFLAVFTFVCFYPFWYIIIYSFSDPVLAARGVIFLPRGFTFYNLTSIFQLQGLPRATVNSVLRTVLGSTITVFSCALFAYVLTKDRLPARKIIYRFAIVTMYLGAGLIPWFLVMVQYGFQNNFLVYIIPSAVNVFYVILFKTFIEQLPQSFEESARIDGAGYGTCFIEIIIPLSVPIITTIYIFAAVDQWNAFFDNFVFISTRNRHLHTLQYILFTYLRQAEFVARELAAVAAAMEGRQQLTPMTVRMSITMVITMPILFVYPFAQRYFVKGIMIGAIKG